MHKQPSADVNKAVDKKNVIEPRKIGYIVDKSILTIQLEKIFLNKILGG
ncbi:hypothetical protein [Lysinibacillus agricola]